MSDAFTDIARDEQRARNFACFLTALQNWLVDSSKENYKKVIEAAKSTDAVRRGYWGGQTSISVNIKERLKKLKNGNKVEWAIVLSWIIDGHWREFQELKKFSPFNEKLIFIVDYNEKLIFIVDYDGAFMNVHAEPAAPFKLSNWLVNRIIEAQNFKICDSDRYLIALDKRINPFKLANLENNSNLTKKHILQMIDTIWLGWTINGIDGPRPAR